MTAPSGGMRPFAIGDSKRTHLDLDSWQRTDLPQANRDGM
jgi:hypothetical protein